MFLKSTSLLAEDQVFRIGFGTSKIGSLEHFDTRYVQTRLNLLKELTNIGKIIVDTAPLYGAGFAEIALGKIIPPFRDKLFVATKYYPRDEDSASDLVKSVEGSLERLKILEIDLLQLHWPNPLANLEQILKGLNLLISSGKIKKFGICNYTAVESQEFSKLYNRVPIFSNQVELNLTNINLIDQHFYSNAPKILSFGNLMQGNIALKKIHHIYIDKLAEEYNLSKASLVLLLILSRNRELFSIIKVSSKVHLQEILQIFQTDFSKSDLDNLMNSISATLEVEYLNPQEITLIGDGIRFPYLTESEARMNLLDLIPSPISLSLRIARSQLILPLTVKKIDKHKYIIHSNDPFDQVKKFWAWRIAYPESKVPVLVVD